MMNRTEDRTLRLLRGLLVITALAVGGEAWATPTYLDGLSAHTETTCVTTGLGVTSAVSRVGYVVDPVAQSPKLGDVTLIHAVVTNMNPCNAEVVGIELFLPPGASFAVSPAHPVTCYLGNGTQGGPVSPSSQISCLQTPQRTRAGGSFFGGVLQPGLAVGWSFEIQVPVIFSQQLVGDGNSLLGATMSSVFGVMNVTVPVLVPFVGWPAQQPGVPSPYAPWTSQPAPNPFAIGEDIALLGSSSSGTTLPVAFSNDDGSFTVTSWPVGDFAVWARLPNVQRLTGDFNADGVKDYALVGGQGWHAIAVAMSLGNGRFYVTAAPLANFPDWASWAGVKALPGDFDGDGYTDIALVGGGGWNTIPVAFNIGDGNFNVSNLYVGDFAGWASWSGARVLTGDFNKDGLTDLALTGSPAFGTLPVAFSYGNGSFLVTNQSIGPYYAVIGASIVPTPTFAALAAAPNVQVLTGDFNKDGFTDIALTGGYGWTSIPVAFSSGNGTFFVTIKPAPTFAGWATTPGARALTGDFNKDGFVDIALVGGSGWNTLPVATNLGFGAFSVTNGFVGDFGSWASSSGARAVAGDFNGDGFTDVALVGAAGWNTLPVAFNLGYGAFNVTNKQAIDFAGWASDATATVVAGRLD